MLSSSAATMYEPSRLCPLHGSWSVQFML